MSEQKSIDCRPSVPIAQWMRCSKHHQLHLASNWCPVCWLERSTGKELGAGRLRPEHLEVDGE